MRCWWGILICLAMACMGCRSDKVAATVELWAMGTEGEQVQRLVPGFVQRFPGVQVRIQRVPWSAAHEKLLTAYVAGTLPDVIQVGNTWIPELAAIGALEPLDGRLRSPMAADFFEGILDTNRVDGVTWGVPWYVDTRLLFYRSDLLAAAGYETAPATWATWVDAMERLKQSGGRDRHALFVPIREWQLPVALALQLGAELLREGNRYGNFRSPEFRLAFRFYLDLFQRGFAPFTGDAQITNIYQDFAAGFFTFYVSGPWNLGELDRRLPELRANWSTAPLPGPDRERPGVSLAGGPSLSLVQGSPHADLAWSLIEYLSEPQQQLEFYRLTGDLPSRRAAWEKGELRAGDRARAFWEQLQHVRATPKIPEWERIAELITRYSEAAVRGEISIDAALAGLDADTDAALEKRRWMLRRRASREPGSGSRRMDSGEGTR